MTYHADPDKPNIYIACDWCDTPHPQGNSHIGQGTPRFWTTTEAGEWWRKYGGTTGDIPGDDMCLACRAETHREV